MTPCGVAQQSRWSLDAFEAAGAAKPVGEEFGDSPYRQRLGPRDVEDFGRRGAIFERTQRIGARVALPDYVEGRNGERDRLAGVNLARDIHEDAVAEIYRVVQAE